MRSKLLLAALVLEAAILVGSCGARSGLLEPRGDGALDGGGFGGSPVVDAAIDRDADATPDVSEDVTPDVPKDVEKDGLPPCDPEALFVYLVTAEFDLYRYDPSKSSFFLVGKLACPTTGSPFSMGVSRTGTAYVVYRPNGLPGSNPPGHLFAVSTADASCEQTSFEPGQLGFNLFGMGFAIDDDLLGETLYVAASGEDGQNSLGLGSIDHLNDFALSFVGPFSENPGNRIELTSADDGQLYGYFIDPQGNGGYIVRIDKTTAEILETTHIDAGGDNSAFAFAYWSGDFYIFTSPLGGPTTITRYRPTDGTVTKVSTLAKTVVGAGVSTCTTK
jgi:hypothetical protein